MEKVQTCYSCFKKLRLVKDIDKTYGYIIKSPLTPNQCMSSIILMPRNAIENKSKMKIPTLDSKCISSLT